MSENKQDDFNVLCAEGKYDKIEKLLKKKTLNVNFQEEKGWTALMVASYFDHHNVCKLLIDFGADPQIKDVGGSNCLIHPSAYGNDNAIEAILESVSADVAKLLVNIENENGLTPMFCAIEGNNPSTLGILLRYGANVEYVNKFGKNFSDYIEASEEILKNAEINQTNIMAIIEKSLINIDKGTVDKDKEMVAKKSKRI